MTASQFATLRWLAEIGGTCIAWRDKVAHPSMRLPVKGKFHREFKHGLMPAISALHLVQQGCIEARDGELHITAKGRAHLSPMGKVAA